MKKETLFEINYWSTNVTNFKSKKLKLLNLLKSYPEKKQGIQEFYTNRQSNRTFLNEGFTTICKDEMEIISKTFKKDIQIEDVWSVTYKNGDYHKPHNHGTVGLTGILYLQLDSTNPTTLYIQPWNDIENDCSQYYKMPVVEGMMTIVPKFVNHFTIPNKSKKSKKIISFDMKFN